MIGDFSWGESVAFSKPVDAGDARCSTSSRKLSGAIVFGMVVMRVI